MQCAYATPHSETLSSATKLHAQKNRWRRRPKYGIALHALLQYTFYMWLVRVYAVKDRPSAFRVSHYHVHAVLESPPAGAPSPSRKQAVNARASEPYFATMSDWLSEYVFGLATGRQHLRCFVRTNWNHNFSLHTYNSLDYVVDMIESRFHVVFCARVIETQRERRARINLHLTLSTGEHNNMNSG